MLLLEYFRMGVLQISCAGYLKLKKDPLDSKSLHREALPAIRLPVSYFQISIHHIR